MKTVVLVIKLAQELEKKGGETWDVQEHNVLSLQEALDIAGVQNRV